MSIKDKINDLEAEGAVINLEKQDYLDILDFLNNHAGEGYKSLDKIENQEEKDRCNQLKTDAQETIKKFKEIGNFFKKYGYSYNSNASTWLDGSNTKVRNYLWIELKKEQKEKFSTSISLVAEKHEELRFRVSLEIKDNKSEEEDYIRHFRYLNILDVYNTNFEYFGKTNADLNNKDDINKWVNQVKNRSEKKLQIGRTINYGKVQDMSKEDIDRFFQNAVAELEVYYNEAVKEGVEAMKDNNSMSKNQILYGPPGTGKTYNAIYRALEIINRDKYKDIIEDSNKRDEAVSIFNQLLEDGQIAFCTFHQSYGYEEFVEGLRSSASGLGFEPKDGVFKHICERAIGTKESNDDLCDASNNYVLVIDEINRGNISKIFGELITLIEESKRLGREEGMEVVLPYSGETFGVPDNVYIVGTMNTADRSIALMDTALRRRFKFIEKMPDADILREVGADIVEDEYGEEIDVALMLEIINERIEYLYDREHTIGHAFFTELKDDNSIEKLGNIFEESIIPLLQEYFYEDYSKIQLVLGDNCKSSDDYKFILDEKLIAKDIFNGNVDDIDLPDKKYMIQEEAFWDINSYREIGEGI